MKKLHYNNCKIFKDERDIVHIDFSGRVMIAPEEIIDDFLHVKFLVKHKPMLMLINARNLDTLSHKARMIIEREHAPSNAIAKAILISSPFDKVWRNFLLKINSRKTSVKLFTSQMRAVEWLKSFEANSLQRGLANS